jgi:hypothetical protein
LEFFLVYVHSNNEQAILHPLIFPMLQAIFSLPQNEEEAVFGLFLILSFVFLLQLLHKNLDLLLLNRQDIFD